MNIDIRTMLTVMRARYPELNLIFRSLTTTEPGHATA